MRKTVAIGGLGAIGLKLARALDAGVDGLQLIAVAARDLAKATANVRGFQTPPQVVPLDRLAEADIVVEAAPAEVFEKIAIAAIEAGRIFVPASVGALLPRMHLVRRAQETGARIVVPTGALLGLDAVRAAAEGHVASITIETRKPPRGLEGAPYLVKHGIDVSDLTAPMRVFEGNAFDAAAGFPANVNVAAALALAGIGPTLTRVEIWADPSVDRNIHTIRVEAECGALHHDDRECAECGEPAHRADHRAVDAGLSARTGVDAEGRFVANADAGGAVVFRLDRLVRLRDPRRGAASQRHRAGDRDLPGIHRDDRGLRDVGLCVVRIRPGGKCRLARRADCRGRIGTPRAYHT